ncbi:MAG: nucleotide exchange factor GrpE [Methanobacteriota archaeon]|nr:MAG: nucleotide exchange factor GrpE [Euryarchaeota archaeon]
MPDDSEDSLPSKKTVDSTNHSADVATDQETMAAKDAKIDELTDTVKRTQAEFENYRKRVEREWAERSRLAGEHVILDLLAVLDTLDKAVNDASEEERNSQEIGLEGIRRQLMQTLQRAGLKEIATDGPFDPFFHEALMMEESDDEDDGAILEVFQKGYMLGPKVIRTARVKVSASRSKCPKDDTGGSIQDEDEEVDNDNDRD